MATSLFSFWVPARVSSTIMGFLSIFRVMHHVANRHIPEVNAKPFLLWGHKPLQEIRVDQFNFEHHIISPTTTREAAITLGHISLGQRTVNTRQGTARHEFPKEIVFLG